MTTKLTRKHCLALASVCALFALHSAQADPACECRAPEGRRASLGDRLCLRAADGQWRVAVCDMALNNTSWRTTGETCAPVSLGHGGTRG